jgi:hypothetical protein
MAYFRIHTIKKHKYLYKHESYRVPGQKNPKKKTTYIGPLYAVTLAVQGIAIGPRVIREENKHLQMNLDPTAAHAARYGRQLGHKQDVAKAAEREATFKARDKGQIWDKAVAEEKAATKSGASGEQYSSKGDATSQEEPVR